MGLVMLQTYINYKAKRAPDIKPNIRLMTNDFDHSQPCHKPFLILPFHPIFHHSYGNSYQMFGSRHAQPREGSREGGRSEPVADEDPAWSGHLHHRLVLLARVNHLIDFSLIGKTRRLRANDPNVQRSAATGTHDNSCPTAVVRTAAGFSNLCRFSFILSEVAARCVCEFSKSGCFVCLQVFKWWLLGVFASFT